MIITVGVSTQSKLLHRDVRQWCRDNGFSSHEIVLPCWVDTNARTISVNKLVFVEGQENSDFPEPQLDAFYQPLTEAHQLPLLSDPPRWLVDDAYGTDGRSSTAA